MVSLPLLKKCSLIKNAVGSGNAQPRIIKDHLGNIRVTVDENGSVVTADDYYPFGLQMPGRSYNVAFSGNQYKFGSKELDDENNLNWHWFEVRPYDAQIGRFTLIDVHAHRYQSWSPYNYAFNNPMLFIDPTGKDGFKFNLQGGFAGGIFNAQGSIGLAYDFKSIYITGSFGFGGATYTKGVALTGGVTGEYFTGDLKNGGANAYVMGVAGEGVTGMIKVTTPIKDLNKVDGLLPTASDLKQMDIDGSAGGGVGGGAAVMAGVEESGVLLEINDSVEDKLNLGNQSGSAPADASNVNNINPDDVQPQPELDFLEN